MRYTMKCACCDIELTGMPLLAAGKAFCCAGCAAGGPCVCSYEGEQGRQPQNGHVDPLFVADLFQRATWSSPG